MSLAGISLGWFAPPPGAKSGVADYASALGAALQPDFPLCRDADGDVNVYQIGNNELHRDIYAQALRRPGVAVIHDAVLQHFFLGSLPREAYIEEFVHNYGEWQRGQAEALWANRGRSAAGEEYFRYPMLRRIAERSLAVVVHNPVAAAMVRAHAPAAEVVEIPHFYAAPTELAGAQDVLAWREARGLRWDTCLFGVFGYLRESKRVRAVHRAMRELGDLPVALLLQGEPVPGQAPLPTEGVIRVGYASERDFWLMAAAVDVCVNLRWPSAGETSGIQVRLMGLGKPCIVTAGGEVSRLPAGSCFPVDPGAHEGETLAAAMRWLAGDPVRRREMGRLAATHTAREHGLARVVDAYAALFRRVKP